MASSVLTRFSVSSTPSAPRRRRRPGWAAAAWLIASACLVLGAPSGAAAQVAASAPAAAAQPASRDPGADFITPHITDSREIDYPCLRPGFVCVQELPRWAPLRIGSLEIDLSPTKHVVWLLIAAILCLATLLAAARFHRRHVANPAVAPGGFAAGIEAMVLYLRQTVVLPNVGPHGDAYTPFILTLFFFILFANLVGLIPYGSTATGNISVTLMLALVSFVVTEVSGMVALGSDYWKTVVYWNTDLKLPLRVLMAILMSPIEVFSKFTKPFALTIRLFANMIAGHVVLLALISLIFTFGSYWIAAAPVLMGVAISLLEIFVAFLQAFIFAILTAVFIGQIRAGAH